MDAKGFTLIELVVTLTVGAIVAVFAAHFVAQPVRGYSDQARRAELVDRAEMSLRRIARDVRRALPNSVRVTINGSVVALEMLETLDGTRYRIGPPPADPTKQLDFSAADDQFNAIGGFGRIAKPFSSTTAYLSIYNVGVPGASAYELANVITPPGTQIDIVNDAIAGEDHVTLAPPFRFAFESPAQRAYLVSGPVSYLCDPVSGTLRRYQGYSIATLHTDRDSDAELTAAGASATLIADSVNACDFVYAAGTAQRAALLTAEVRVAALGEAVSLLHQIHVNNAP